jgi:transcriptional regulator with XRE-family HTH domain
MHIRSSSVLRDYIALIGLSEREFARAAGISHSTLNHLLSGRRSTCSERTSQAIERTLGCRPGVFFSSN